jgi:flagellin
MSVDKNNGLLAGISLMNTSSILTNSSALTALQSLSQTEQALATTQNEVSTGLAVGSAAANAAYWSIATQLSSNGGVIGAVNDALTQSQSVLDTATSALNSIITTINSIETALTEATNPGSDIGDVNTTLASLGKQLTDAVVGASFNGLNVLDGSQTATLNFVAGYNQSTSGAQFNTIAFTAQALTGTAGTTITTQEPELTDATTIAELNALPDNHTATVAYGQNVVDKTTDTTGDSFTVESEALDGTLTTTTYTGLDINGNKTTAAAAVAFQVSSTTTSSGGILTQNGVDLTNMTTSSTTASAQLVAVRNALQAVTTYSSIIGSTLNRMTTAQNFNSASTTDYTNGVSGLVDANMNEASTRLQALQTQQQLGIQSLSIANQNSQLILKLFQGG